MNFATNLKVTTRNVFIQRLRYFSQFSFICLKLGIWFQFRQCTRSRAIVIFFRSIYLLKKKGLW